MDPLVGGSIGIYAHERTQNRKTEKQQTSPNCISTQSY